MAAKYTLHPETAKLAEMSKDKPPFDPKKVTLAGFRTEAVQGNNYLNSSYKCDFTGTKFELFVPSTEVAGELVL